ncbi:hypothetical protein F0919_02425 [Taibaiella lutea]|uniref:RHS repeat-associated core domain-containing protein n=1 Tax=Taibaiella lutea TaxID=2608001 RepID=A0A5M6CNB7_9BACT|nr:RHS repeat-associated core domain-containing protein [Taibaiella lutea]KAA5536543.1 hypothetical protein F0919_02425 [Taibaiella lutea]
MQNGANPQPYKLTTKELESNFGLNIYDFGARMQDMQLGRWWQIDPMAEDFYNMSQYSYCGNNPANLVDPDGMKWLNTNDEEIAKRLQEGISKRLTTENANLTKANAKIADIKAEIKKSGGSDKLNNSLKAAEANVASISSTISDLNSSSTELSEMGNATTTQVFTFDNSSDAVTYTEKKSDGVIHMGNSSDANALHEAVHGFQIFKGTMDNSNRIDREVVPYQRQYSFDPNSMTSSKVPSDYGRVSSRSDITRNWVWFINDSKGNYPYFDPGTKQSAINGVLKVLREQEKGK